DIVKAGTVVVSALAVSLGDVQGDRQRGPSQLVRHGTVATRELLEKACHEGKKLDRGLVRVQILVIQLRVGAHGRVLSTTGDGDGDANGNGNGNGNANECWHPRRHR